MTKMIRLSNQLLPSGLSTCSALLRAGRYMADQRDLALSSMVALHRLNIAESLQAAVRNECDVLCDERCPNLWVPAAQVNGQPMCATQILISRIHGAIMAGKTTSAFSGVEVWVQVGQPVACLSRELR